jgi:putative spermidine/putrescine transport system permease protein
MLLLVGQTFVTTDGIGLGLWARILGQSVNQRAIVTSLELGLVCATISTLIGTPVAWLITRMLPGGRSIWLGLFNVAAHFGGIGLAFAYVATLGIFGMLTLLIQGLGIGFIPPPRASFGALVLVFEYANLPFFVLLTVPAMAIVRHEWLEAAQTASASRWQFWRRIGLPVLAPFIAAGFVLCFTWAIGNFAIAYGLAGTTATLPVPLITLLIGSALEEDVLTGAARAAVLSVVLMAIAFGALLVFRRLTARGARWFASGPISGAASVDGAWSQTGPGRGSGTGRRQTAGRALLLGAVATYLCLPVVAVLLYSLATRWTAHLLPDGYTLDWWSGALGDPRVTSAFATSFALGGLTAILDLLLVVPAVYWGRVRNRRIRPVLEVAAAVPFALPYLVIGIALLQFAGAVAPQLQGTFVLLVMAYAAVSFPLMYWAVDGAMAAAGIERISEAAETCGASSWQIVRRVVMPNIKSGAVTGVLLCFAMALGEFAIVNALAGSVRTISVWSAGAIRESSTEAGGTNELAVVTTITFALLFVVSAAAIYGNRGRSARLVPGADVTEKGAVT